MSKNSIFKTLFSFIPIIIMFFTFQFSFQAPKLIESFSENSGRFNGVNAVQILKNYLPEDQPHPLLSENNEKVRQRIVDNLESYGYTPKIQIADG